MAGVSGRTVEVKLRLPVDLNAVVMARVQAGGGSKSQVIISMIRDGLAAGSGRAPATRDDVSALRDQVAALAEFQKAQAIALMDGVRNAIADAPLQALPSGVPEVEHARLIAEKDALIEARAKSEDSLRAEVNRLRSLLDEERERSRSIMDDAERDRAEAVDAERGRMEAEFEARLPGIKADAALEGYMRAVDESGIRGLVKRAFRRQ